MIFIIFPDIYFSKYLNKYELTKAISQIFKIGEEDILIVPNINNIDPYLRKKIICESYKLNEEHEFRIMLTFAIDDSIAPKNDIEIYSQLIDLLDCKLMFDNYSSVPGAMLILEKKNIILDELENISEYLLD